MASVGIAAEQERITGTLFPLLGYYWLLSCRSHRPRKHRRHILAALPRGLPQIALRLHPNPKLGVGAEGLGEAKPHLGGNPCRSIQDAGQCDPSDPKMTRGVGH